MPRQARIYFPGGIFHIISRCLKKEYLLDGSEERARYLVLLGEASKRTDTRVLAWCMMSNHVHLVVRAGEEPLQRLMRSVNVGYANWKNRKDQRIGPVFAERFKAVLLEEELHLREAVRYVHLNPVRAGIVAHPDDSTWTSHRIYAGLEQPPPWFDPQPVLSWFGQDEPTARRAYVRFVEEGIGEGRSAVLSGDKADPAIREILQALGDANRPSGPIVGSAAFLADVLEQSRRPVGRAALRSKASIEQRRPTLEALIDLVCAVLEIERPLFDERPKCRGPNLARRILTRLWLREFRGKQVDIARHLRVPTSIVSRWHGRSFAGADELEDAYAKVVAALPLLEHGSPAGDQPAGERADARVTVNLELNED